MVTEKQFYKLKEAS